MIYSTGLKIYEFSKSLLKLNIKIAETIKIDENFKKTNYSICEEEYSEINEWLTDKNSYIENIYNELFALRELCGGVFDKTIEHIISTLIYEIKNKDRRKIAIKDLLMIQKSINSIDQHLYRDWNQRAIQ